MTVREFVGRLVELAHREGLGATARYEPPYGGWAGPDPMRPDIIVDVPARPGMVKLDISEGWRRWEVRCELPGLADLEVEADRAEQLGVRAWFEGRQ